MQTTLEDLSVTEAELDEQIAAVKADYPAVDRRVFPLLRWCGCCGVPVVPERFRGLKRADPEPYEPRRAGDHPLSGRDGLPVLQYGVIEVRGQEHECCRACRAAVRADGLEAARRRRAGENLGLFAGTAARPQFLQAVKPAPAPAPAVTPDLFAGVEG